MDMIDLDDQIRIMAAIIASGMLQKGTIPNGLPKEAVDLAAAINEEVDRYVWKFNQPRVLKKPNE